MTNEKIVEFFKNHPKLFVDLIFRWYPINLRILFKILNNMPYNVTYSSYKNLLQNDAIFKDLLLIEVALGDSKYLHEIIKWNYYKLPSEFIKKHFMKVKNYYSNSDIGKLSSLNLEDITDELINRLRTEDELINKIENPEYDWTIEKIEENKSLINFILSRLSAKHGKFWTKELINKYKDNWSSYWYYELAQNPYFYWDLKLIYQFEDKLKEDFMNHKYNSRDYNDEEKNEFYNSERGKLFYYLSENKSKFWTKELLEKYKEEWSWEELSKNIALPWDEELIEKYQNKWNWGYLSQNIGINWTTNLIDKYFSQLNLSRLVENERFPWTIELVISHKDKLRINDLEIETLWKVINTNKYFKWIDKINHLGQNDFEQIRKNAGIFYQLNETKNSNMSVERLRFEIAKESYFIGDRNYNLNQEMPWCDEIVNYLTKNIESTDIINTAFEQCISYWYHVDNPSIPWTLELLDEYEYYWNWDKIIESEKIWEIVFKKTLNDELILTVIDGFNKKENYEDYTYRFNSSPNFYTINSSLDFGLYKGKKIIDAFKDDQDYFNNLLESSGPFYLSKEFLKKLETITTFKFTEKAHKMAYKKQLHVEKENLNERMRDEDNYNQNHSNDFDFLNDALEGDPMNYWNID